MNPWVLPFNYTLRVGATPGFQAMQLNFIAKNNGLIGDDHEYCS